MCWWHDGGWQSRNFAGKCVPKLELWNEGGNQSEIISDLHRPRKRGGFMPHWGAAFPGGAAQSAAGLRHTAGAV